MQVESSFAGKAPARGVEVSTAPFGSDVPLGEPSWYQNLNTPYYNASHIAWRAKLRDFFEKEVEPSASSRGSRLVVFLAFDRRGAFRDIRIPRVNNRRGGGARDRRARLRRVGC